MKELAKELMVAPGKKIKLPEIDAGETHGIKKADAEAHFDKDRERLSVLQYLLYAEGQRAVMVVLQGIDAAGKDGTIRHVMSGVNPQGVPVRSFKVPTDEELLHDFLWRYQCALR